MDWTNGNWDEKEDNMDRKDSVNSWRHGRECPNCRSVTWSFCCLIPDFKTGGIDEGCNECDDKVKGIWDRENITGGVKSTVIILGVVCSIGIAVGYFLP